jgi:K(+)-stimulated pyrophosphate-energized sodium pump
MESFVIYLPIVLSLVGLLYMLVKRAWVMKQDAGDGKMKEISDHIYEGALAFLMQNIGYWQYLYLLQVLF